MNIRRGMLLAIAGALEALAVIAAVRDSVPVTLALHAGSSACVAWGAGGRLLEPRGSWTFALPFMCALFVPVMGALGLATVALVLPRCAAQRRPLETFVRTPVPRPPERAALRRCAAVARQRPANERDERDARVEALSASRGRTDRASVALLWRGLKDADEEVRLLAFALLESKTCAAYRRIHAHTQELETASGALRGLLNARLAFEHWELAWLGLVQGEILIYELGVAEQRARAALEHEPRSASLHLLLGRIQLRRNRLDQARAMFVRAAELGLPAAVQRPYLAEVEFRERRLASAAAHLARAAVNGTDLSAALLQRYSP
jgi:Flp pilus assembly protein TadD